MEFRIKWSLNHNCPTLLQIDEFSFRQSYCCRIHLISGSIMILKRFREWMSSLGPRVWQLMTDLQVWVWRIISGWVLFFWTLNDWRQTTIRIRQRFRDHFQYFWSFVFFWRCLIDAVNDSRDKVTIFFATASYHWNSFLSQFWWFDIRCLRRRLEMFAVIK